MISTHASRRRFLGQVLRGSAATALTSAAGRAQDSPFRLRYVLSSCLYGTTPLEEILPEVAKTGAHHIDIWPRVHGDQREQIEAMGYDRFRELLRLHDVELGIFTHYDLGPFGLQDEMRVVKKLGGQMVVSGGRGPLGLTGADLRTAVAEFAEAMKPHIEEAEETGVVIAIENHSRNLIDSPDSVKWLMEFAPSKHIGIALAPYHLEQDVRQIAGLISALGDRLVLLYAWQHGKGADEKLPKVQELEQLPGRGPLAFAPIVGALRKINYQGWVSIFMHPVPRGVPILDTTEEVTAEINRARAYLERLVSAARLGPRVARPDF